MMKCQQGLLSQLKRFSRREDLYTPIQSLPQALAADEYVARFIFETREIFSNGAAKPNPFMPVLEKSTGVLETSVCRKTNISDERIWELAKTVRIPKVAIARADLSVADIHKSSLEAHAAPEPEINYFEHSVIVGWPLGEDVKAKHKQIAINLAAEAKVIKVPS